MPLTSFIEAFHVRRASSRGAGWLPAPGRLSLSPALAAGPHGIHNRRPVKGRGGASRAAWPEVGMRRAAAIAAVAAAVAAVAIAALVAATIADFGRGGGASRVLWTPSCEAGLASWPAGPPNGTVPAWHTQINRLVRA